METSEIIGCRGSQFFECGDGGVAELESTHQHGLYSSLLVPPPIAYRFLALPSLVVVEVAIVFFELGIEIAFLRSWVRR